MSGGHLTSFKRFCQGLFTKPHGRPHRSAPPLIVATASGKRGAPPQQPVRSPQLVLGHPTAAVGL